MEVKINNLYGKGGEIKCTYAVMGEINNLSHQTCDKNKWSDSVFEIINFRQEKLQPPHPGNLMVLRP